LWDDVIGKDDIVGIVAVPLAGMVAGVEKTQFYKLEKSKSGEIEIGVTTTFTMPPCDPLVYSSAVSDTINQNLIDVDPITYEKKNKEKDSKKEKSKEKKKKVGKALKGVGKFLSKFVSIEAGEGGEGGDGGGGGE